MPRPWTTDAQRTFLKSRMPQYLEAQATGDLSVFWPRVYREWFEVFPEKDVEFPGRDKLTAEEETILGSKVNHRQEMLRTWFRWRNNNTVRKKQTEITFSIPKPRHLQDVQVYSKLFYNQELKPMLEKEIDGNLPRTERIAQIMKMTKREYDKASDEVKAKVKAKKAEMYQELLTSLESGPPTPKQAQAGINNLPELAGKFFKYIKRTTGWTGFIVLGGPQPIQGGLNVASYFSDEDTINDQTFQIFHPGYQREVVVPFGEYLRMIYSSSSVNIPQDLSTNPDTHGDPHISHCGISNGTNISSVPDLPNDANNLGVPGVPNLPSALNIPSVPGIPDLPGLSNLSNLPNLPGLPDVPDPSNILADQLDADLDPDWMATLPDHFFDTPCTTDVASLCTLPIPTASHLGMPNITMTEDTSQYSMFLSSHINGSDFHLAPALTALGPSNPPVLNAAANDTNGKTLSDYNSNIPATPPATSSDALLSSSPIFAEPEDRRRSVRTITLTEKGKDIGFIFSANSEKENDATGGGRKRGAAGRGRGRGRGRGHGHGGAQGQGDTRSAKRVRGDA